MLERVLAPLPAFVAAVVTLAIAWITLPANVASIVLPAVATFAVFVVFAVTLWRRVGPNLLGELGFAYVGLAVAYTAIPAIVFLIIETDAVPGWGKLSALLATPDQTGAHLWRHAVFVVGISAGYLWARGYIVPDRGREPKPEPRAGSTIVFLMGMITGCMLIVSALSAPVTNYIEHYTRFDHLSWLPLKFVQIALLLKTGGYFILIAFLFRGSSKNRLLAFPVIAAICVYEITHSYGARIEALALLLGAFCAFHYDVRLVTLRAGAVAAVAIVVLFTVVEIVRASGNDLSLAEDAISSQGAIPASEFSAVYVTGFHLYEERASGTLPPREWPMFFSDLIAILPFVDHTRWHPEFWYARNYFPDAVVPPETMGPIAESAMWGGEPDLLLRSVLSGVFFGYVTRWFVRRRTHWWAMVIYAYIYATSMMALKYSVFYHLNPILRMILPSILFVGFVRRFVLSNRVEDGQREYAC